MSNDDGRPFTGALSWSLLSVESHYARQARTTYEPWTPESREYLGWCLWRNGEEHGTVVYAVPDTEAAEPTVLVYAGTTGSPEEDECVAVVVLGGGEHGQEADTS